MKNNYDTYYKTENLFGNIYPELLEFFTTYETNKTILDLGCGQGRDAIPLARLGFKVIGVDYSKVGIEQMLKISKQEKLNITGIIEDVYSYNHFKNIDFVLLDSMFHFYKKDLKKETQLIQNIVNSISANVKLVICIQNTSKKVKILKESLLSYGQTKLIKEQEFKYTFVDSMTGQSSKTPYLLYAVEKMDS